MYKRLEQLVLATFLTGISVRPIRLPLRTRLLFFLSFQLVCAPVGRYFEMVSEMVFTYGSHFVLYMVLSNLIFVKHTNIHFVESIFESKKYQ